MTTCLLQVATTLFGSQIKNNLFRTTTRNLTQLSNEKQYVYSKCLPGYIYSVAT